MEWIDTLFVEHTALQAVVVVALICAAGMALGKVRIGGISLGGTFDIASAKGKGMRAAIRVNTQEEPAPLNRNHNRKRRRR